ncbi:MAG: hypothetical protein U1E24_08555 [Phenylobacterium sp.]|nr:hypothetical protein [Phenylobacterium sp.]
MMDRWTTVAGIVAVGAWSPAAAQSDVLTQLYGTPNSNPDNITLQSDVLPMFSEGRLMGCSVVFQVLQRDNVYRDGDWVLLDGSIGLLYVSGSAIGATIKLGVGSIGPDNSAMRTAPAVAALIGKRSNVSAGEIFTSEETQPGFRFFILDITKTKQSAFLEAWATAQVSQRINGYYTLEPGGLGSNFYVDMRVRQYQPSKPDSIQLAVDAGDRLAACTEDLFALADEDARKD